MMANHSDPASGTPDSPAAAPREVRFEYSRYLPALLAQLRTSLLVSTYQAGKLVVVGVDPNGSLALSFYTFERAMGVAVRPDRLAVGAQSQIWTLRSAPDVARRLPPAGRHDACFLARSSRFTGDIHVHEMAWADEELWV